MVIKNEIQRFTHSHGDWSGGADLVLEGEEVVVLGNHSGDYTFYTFDKVNDIWEPNSRFGVGQAGDLTGGFERSGDTIISSDSSFDNVSNNGSPGYGRNASGKVYIWTKSNSGTWALESELREDTTSAGSTSRWIARDFGSSFSLYNDWLIVLSKELRQVYRQSYYSNEYGWFDDTNNFQNVAFVYQRVNGSWVQNSRIVNVTSSFDSRVEFKDGRMSYIYKYVNGGVDNYQIRTRKLTTSEDMLNSEDSIVIDNNYDTSIYGVSAVPSNPVSDGDYLAFIFGTKVQIYKLDGDEYSSNRNWIFQQYIDEDLSIYSKSYRLLEFDNGNLLIGDGEDVYKQINGVWELDSTLIGYPNLSIGYASLYGDEVVGIHGDYLYSFNVSEDYTPDQFVLRSVANASTGSEQESNIVTITGLGNNVSVPLIVNSNQSVMIKKNSDNFLHYTLGSIFVTNNDNIKVKMTSPTNLEESYSTEIYIGGTTSVWSVSTSTNDAPVVSGTPPSNLEVLVGESIAVEILMIYFLIQITIL